MRAFNAWSVSHSALLADENAIATRKANIRRFGAGWLRPPGVAKTLQGMEDEQLEREEQEAAALRYILGLCLVYYWNGLHADDLNREQALAEAQHAAEEEAEAAARLLLQQQQQGEGQQQTTTDPRRGMNAEERDLDAEIPEASSPVYASGLDDTEGFSPTVDAEWVDEADGGLPLADDEGDGDYAEDLDDRQAVGDGSAMFMEQDLDDDVPEAGSYQHTDTDVEDSSSTSSDDAGIDTTDAARSHQHGVWASQTLPPTMAAARQSFGGGGLASSIFGSSPVVAAETARRTRNRIRRSAGMGS